MIRAAALFLLCAVAGMAQDLTSGKPKGTSGDPITATVTGTKTNNNAAPGATNNGALTAIANAAAQTWTEGNQVLTSVDLAGNLRTQDITTGSTGSAVPAKARYIGGNGSGNLTGLITCDNSTAISVAAAATTIIVALTSAKTTYICGVSLFAAGTTNVALVTGTGTTCATGIAGLFGGTTAATGWNLVAQTGVALGGGLGMISKGGSASDICLINSAAIQVSGYIAWTKF